MRDDRALKIILAITIAVLIEISTLSIVIATGQDLYSSMWDKGVVVVIYGDQYGTGWWVEKRHIVTAAHVVDFQTNARVNIIRGDYQSIGTVLYVNQFYDIAIIKVENEPETYYIWSLAKDDPEKAAKIFVVGYPYELYQLIGDIKKMSTMPRVAQGIVAWVHPDRKIFEFQAATDSGNSGGPVVDEDGNVVGVVSFALRGNVAVLYYGTAISAVKDALERVDVKYKVGLSSTAKSTSSSTYQSIFLAAIVGGLAALVTVIILVPAAMRGGKAWARYR